MSIKHSTRSKFLLGVAASALAISGSAFAQDADTESEDVIETISESEESTESRQEKIVVTGSLLRRDEYSSSSPIQVITADTATLQGLVDTAEILQSSSVASGSTQINGNFGGFVVEGGTGVNSISLRGLGAQRSLVLFNGRRLGGAGTQGQVGAVDLNVIPDAAISRIEILKDGASSIYGSDAVAGVVNVITRRQIDSPEINFTYDKPFDTGGESWGVDGAYGLNFDRGSAVISASYEKFEKLEQGDREFLACPADYIFASDGGPRIDIPDTRVDGGAQRPYKCYNALAGVYDGFGVGRFIYDESIDDYRLRAATSPDSVSETPYNIDRELSTSIIPETERMSLFATADYDFGGVEFFGDFLYNRRETEQTDFRQFFPYLLPTDPGNPLVGVTYARPIALVPFNTSVSVDYVSATAGLRGDFGDTSFLNGWDWEVAAVYSRSDGDYERDTIPLNRVVAPLDGGGAINVADPSSPLGFSCMYIPDEAFMDDDPSNDTYESCPTTINYFGKDFLYGELSDEEKAFLIAKDSGNTVYDQLTLSGLVRGELFELPAGKIGIAVGVEHREFSIDDQPGVYSANGNQWGLSSAVQTKGEDKVSEIFTEVEIPLLKGQTLAEELTVNLSGRYFDYDSYGSDSVYKAGLNWQIVPSVRLRSTFGTSYRAPALYELFLGNQTSFLGQTSIDPCIDYQDSSNANLRTNCAAAGVPENYQGLGSSAQITTGGGVDVLEAESSEALTVGFVVTPTFADINIALDYFEITVEDQVSRLGSGSILGGCYASENFPNEFCSLFVRDSDPSSPSYLNILTVNDSYINVNSQTTRGLDLTGRYELETKWGDLNFDIQGTWTFEDTVDLFDFDGEDTAFSTDDFNGTIGDPDFTANARLQWVNGDWRYTWFTDFTSRASNDSLFETGSATTYYGEDAYRKIYAEPQWYHGVSVQYRADTWAVTAGIDNLFDEAPPAVTTGATTRRGIVPLVGTQYDYRLRSGFLRVSKSF